jgi:hypothetical protein
MFTRSPDRRQRRGLFLDLLKALKDDERCHGLRKGDGHLRSWRFYCAMATCHARSTHLIS